MDKTLQIDCIRKRYEHEPCLTKEEQARHAEVEIARVMGEKPTTIITEPVAAENNKQRER